MTRIYPRSSTVTLIVVLMICFLCGMASAQQPCHPIPSDIWLTLGGGGGVVCVGVSVTLTLSAGDTDEFNDPTYCYDTLSFSGWPGPAPTRLENGTYYSKWEHTFNGCGVHTYDVTASDGGGCCEGGDDLVHPSDSVTVYVIGVAGVTGTDEICGSGYGNFTAQLCGCPEEGCCDFISWTVDGAYAGYGCSTYPYFSSPGTYVVRASCGASSAAKTVVVKSDELPECPPDQDCGSSSSSCSGGGCGGGGVPTPSLTEQMVYITPVVPGPPGGPGSTGPDTCDGSCSVEVLENCDDPPQRMAYITCCGKCQKVDITNCAPPCEFYLPDGSKFTVNSSSSFKMTSANGATSNFSDYNGFATGPTSTDDPCQCRTIGLDRDEMTGALNKVTMPNGEEWNYQHDQDRREIKKVTAPDGTTTELAYYGSGENGAGKLKFVKQYDNSNPPVLMSETTYAYDAQDRLSSVTTNGKEVAYEYGANSITVKELSVTPQTRTVYTYGNNTTTVTKKKLMSGDDPADQSTTYTFQTIDGKKYEYQVTDSYENTTTYERYTEGDLKGKVYRITDGLGRQTDYEYYDGDGEVREVKKIKFPEVNSVRYEINYTYAQNNTKPFVETVTDTRGATTKYTYNDDWTVQKIEMKPDGGQYETVKEYTYYPGNPGNPDNVIKGLVYTETVPDVGDGDMVTTYGYEDVEVSGKYHLSPTTVSYEWCSWQQYYYPASRYYQYDIMGRLAWETDEFGWWYGYQTEYDYDALGRTKTITYPGANQGDPETTRGYTYGCCGVSAEKDENDHYTRYYYQGGRLWATQTDIQGDDENDPKLVTYSYDAFGNTAGVTSYKNANTARTTTYTYDKLNRVTVIDHPGDLGTEYFQYDAVGNLLAKKDGNGDITRYNYDALNRLIKVDYNYVPDPPSQWPIVDTTIETNEVDVSYMYYAGSNLVHEVDEALGTTEYDYDYRGRMTTYVPASPSGYTISYDYDNANNKTEIEIDDGSSTYTTTYDYYKNGWLKTVSRPEVIEVYYGYNANGDRESKFCTTNYRGTYWEYDRRGRIKRVTQDVGFTHQTDYTRDGVGNPTEIDWLVGQDSWDATYTYDEINRLTQEDHSDRGETNWTYDWVGNRLDTGFVYNSQTDWLSEGPEEMMRGYEYAGSMGVKWGPGYKLKMYNYGPTGLLTQAYEDLPIVTTSFDWDAESRRIGMTTSDSVHYQFIYDPTASVPAVLVELQGEDMVEYIREPDGSLIARLADEDWKLYHFDALGSTVALTNAVGTVTDKYDYDPWGNLEDRTGSTEQPYQYVGQLGYYTHYQDDNVSDFLQLGVRFYEPGVGRFGQRDLLWSARKSSYAYADNRPGIKRDPSGLYPTIVSGKGCGKYGPEMASAINQLTKDVWDLIDEFMPGAAMETCNKQITVDCKDDMGCKKGRRVCGQALSDTVEISFHPGCANPKCLIAHEAIHRCVQERTGRPWPPIIIPGCGNISGQHGPTWPNPQ